MFDKYILHFFEKKKKICLFSFLLTSDRFAEATVQRYEKWASGTIQH